MTSARQQRRSATYAAVLACLNAPGGRQRTHHDIAQECHTSAAFVRTVHDANRTPEEQAAYERGLQRRMKALDSVFPGIYKQQAERHGWEE